MSRDLWGYGVPGPGERTAARTAMPWYHNTDAELNPGDELLPASQRGVPPRWDTRSGYDPNFVYITHGPQKLPQHDVDEPMFGKNIYEVEPVGDIQRDPEWETNKESYGEDYEYEDEIPGFNDYAVPRARVVRRYHPDNAKNDFLNKRKARTMTAAVTVYTQPSCPQCHATQRHLDKLGIEHRVIDVTADPDAHAYVTGLGYTAAPVVVAGDTHWSGYRPDRLKDLMQ